MKIHMLTAGMLLTLGLPVHASQQLSWAGWLMQSVEQHPTMQAYNHLQTSSELSALGMAKPLYNPSLNTSIEQEGSDTNFQIGLSSDIDWWDMKATRTELGNLSAQQARVDKTIITNDLLADIMTAQVQTALGEEAYELAKLQVEQDLKVLQLTRDQLSAGEVNRTEVAMAKAVVGQGMVLENERLSEWLGAQQSLRELAGERAQSYTIDHAFWGSSIASTAGVDVIKLPEVQRSRLNWLEAKQEADRQVQANKPVPNLGVGVGKQAGESIISLNVSVPIQWRNDYREVNEAAREAALASEQQLHAKMLSAQEKLRSLRLQFRQTQQRYEQWRDLHENYLSEEITVLQNRYAQGDLSMADYQWQVQQLRAGMQAGLTLKQNYQITFIAYLHTTGRLAAYVLSLNLQEQ